MAEYLFAYHGGGTPANPEEGAKFMAEWMVWIGSLGTGAINPGTPVGGNRTVTSTGVSVGGGANPVTGYSLVSAVDMEAALAMARRCPHLAHGTIEVAEVKPM